MVTMSSMFPLKPSSSLFIFSSLPFVVHGLASSATYCSYSALWVSFSCWASDFAVSFGVLLVFSRFCPLFSTPFASVDLLLLVYLSIRMSVSWVCCKSVWNIEKISGIFLWNFSYWPALTRYSSENFGNFSEISLIYFYRFFGEFPDVSYQSSPRTGYKICPFFFKKTNKMLFGNLIMICRQRLCSSPSSKIVDLGYVKFKSCGIKAKRPLDQI